MDLNILFILREERYEGENNPEAIHVVDQYTLENSCPEIIKKEREEALKMAGGDVLHSGVITIDVSLHMVRQILLREKKL